MKKYVIPLIILICSLSLSQENILRKIHVKGTSQREILPDTANIYFQIKTEDFNVENAKNKNKKIMENFKNILLKNKISLDEFETTNYYINKNEEITEDFKGIKEKKEYNENEDTMFFDVLINFIVTGDNSENVVNLIGKNDDLPLQRIVKDYEENGFLITINKQNVNINEAIKDIFKEFYVIKEKLIKNGILEKNISFVDYDIKKTYESKTKNLEKYIVVHEFTTSTKDIKNLSEIITLASNNGISLHRNINFSFSNINDIKKEMYEESFKKANKNALNIINSSNLKLYKPIIISEDINFNNMEISEYSITANSLKSAEFTPRLMASEEIEITKFNFNPKTIKIEQNISVIYEMLEKEEK